MSEQLDTTTQPGSAAPEDGPEDLGEGNKKLPEDMQRQAYELTKKFAHRDQIARRYEVQRAKKQRFFSRNIHHPIKSATGDPLPATDDEWSEENQRSATQPTMQQEFDLYGSNEAIFCSAFGQAPVPIRFEPEDPGDPTSIRAAGEAEKMKRVYQKYNDPKQFQIDTARLLWTDGRVVAWTRHVRDGQRFGFEQESYPDEQAEGIQGLEGAEAVAGDEAGTGAESDTAAAGPGEDTDVLSDSDVQAAADSEEAPAGAQADTRTPQGRELTSIFGVLEAKVPMALRDKHKWPGLQISEELDVAMVKEQWQDDEDEIQEGTKVHAEDEYARVARIAVNEGTPVLSLGGDAVAHLVTVDHYWFRRGMFRLLGKEWRDRFRAAFPDGMYIAFCGTKYLESRNESLDDHIEVVYAKPGDGAASPSLGNSEVPINECFDDGMNEAEEILKYCVPAKWADEAAVDAEAVQEQTSKPGNIYTIAKPDKGRPLSDYFHSEDPLQIPQQFLEYIQFLKGDLQQFITGLHPAIFGAEMPNQDTVGVYNMAQKASQDRLGITYGPYSLFYASVVEQAVKCAANSRPEGSKISTLVPSMTKKGETEPVDVDVDSLKGNFKARPIADANFPESWAQKSARFTQLMGAADKNPFVGRILQHPDNQALAKDLIGIEELSIPGADVEEKVLKAIEELLQGEPRPNVGLIQKHAMASAIAQTRGQPKLPPLTPDQALQPSVPVDAECDNHPEEAAVYQRWINGRDGQQAKRENPKGFLNVRLKYLAHKKLAEAMQQPAGKPPSKSINYKDLPPDGQVQLAEEAGLHIAPPAPPVPPAGAPGPAKPHVPPAAAPVVRPKAPVGPAVPTQKRPLPTM
jgi:hypothetical protein